MRATALFAVAALALAAPAAAQPPSPGVVAAVAAPDRPDKDRARDAARHPAELIAFAGVEPGDHIADVWPGSGYWERILSNVVGPKGEVIAIVPDEIMAFKGDPLAVITAVAHEPGRGNIEVIHDKIVSQPPPEAQGTVDEVFIFQNYHDLHDSFVGKPDIGLFNKAIFLALKPGGVFVIVDHAAKAGSGLANTEDLHRIDPAAVKAELAAAGFVFDGESKVLADASDAHDKNVFDPAIRGRTDQFAYRFRKPRS